jgi:hypothetical protein
MKFLRKVIGGRDVATDTGAATDDPLALVPIPAFVTILAALERDKGSPLTENEVLEARDQANCVAMPVSVRDQMARERGYADIDMENAWAEWQAVRESLVSDEDPNAH